MTYEKQDRTEDKGEFKRTIKGDYNIVIKRIDDDQLDTKSLLELSKKNGHSPVLIIQNNQLRIFGYKNRSNVSPGEWKLQELHFSKTIIDSVIQKAGTRNMIKFSELDSEVQNIV